MAYLKFDPANLERLNDPGRFESLPPDALWQALGVADSRTLVEVGAGTGLFAAAFAERAPNATVYAADTSETMIEWMRANRPEVAGGRIVPVLSAEGAVPLETGIADAAYMINLHHELAEPDAIYAEAYRILRPGGRVLVVDWAPVETPKGPPLAVRVSAAELAGVLERAGFTGIETHDSLVWHSAITADKGGGSL